MKILILSGMVSIFLLLTSFLFKPTFNDPSPGCSGGGCHSLDNGIVSAQIMDNFQVQITVTGVSSGKKVAGELVDGNGNIVDYINETSSNPFLLTAPGPGTYLINAGFDDPSKKWDSTNVSFITTDISDHIPILNTAEFILFPNHPNPFNNETVIRYSLPKASTIALNIYDLQGKKVKQLVGGYFQAGIYTFRWNGKNDKGIDLSSGTYIYELKSGKTRVAQRMKLYK